MKMRPSLSVYIFSFLFGQLATAQSVQHKLVFDKPMTLTATQVGIRVQKVESKFDKTKNSWVEGSPSEKVYFCDLSLNIEGRDLAVKNPILNEHYFGSMQLSCPKAPGFSWKAFTTKISRVMIMGIRNCIESETMRDTDYCDVVVMSLQKESDLQASNGDLAEQTKEKRVYYRVTSKEAQKRIGELDLLPEGVNAETLVGYQLFPLSIAAKGNEFFVRNESNYSNLPSGINLYLKADVESSERDNQISQKVQERITNVEKIIKDLQTSTINPDKVNEKFPVYIAEFSTALKTLLAMVSPTEFRRLELQLRGLENQMIELVKSMVSTVTDRDSFVNNYAGKFTDFQSLAGYLNGRNTTINYKRLLDPSAKESEIISNRQRSNPTKPTPIAPVPASSSNPHTGSDPNYPDIMTAIDHESIEGEKIQFNPETDNSYSSLTLEVNSSKITIAGGGHNIPFCRQPYYTSAKSALGSVINEFVVWLGGDSCSVLYVESVDTKYKKLLSTRTLSAEYISHIERVFTKNTTSFVLYRTLNQTFKLVALTLSGDFKVAEVNRSNIDSSIEQFAK